MVDNLILNKLYQYNVKSIPDSPIGFFREYNIGLMHTSIKYPSCQLLAIWPYMVIELALEIVRSILLEVFLASIPIALWLWSEKI